MEGMGGTGTEERWLLYVYIYIYIYIFIVIVITTYHAVYWSYWWFLPYSIPWVLGLPGVAYNMTEDPDDRGHRPATLCGKWQLQSFRISNGDGR